MSSTPADAGRTFRPRLWPTLATVAGLAVLLALGTWQLQRMAWKRDLIAHAEAQLAAPAHPLPAGDLSALDYRRVSASGTYLHDLAFAFGFSAEGGRPGGRLITPFRLDGRPDHPGRSRLDARGPAAAQRASRSPAGRHRGRSKASPAGVETRSAPGWPPTTRRPQRRWYNWDIPAMAAALGLTIEPLELVLERSEGSAGSAQGGAGLDRFPQRPSELRDSPGTGSPWSSWSSTSCSAPPSPASGSLETDPHHRRRHRDPGLCPDRPGCRGPHHQFRPVLPRLAHLLWPLGAAAVRSRGRARTSATPMPRSCWSGCTA